MDFDNFKRKRNDNDLLNIKKPKINEDKLEFDGNKSIELLAKSLLESKLTHNSFIFDPSSDFTKNLILHINDKIYTICHNFMKYIHVDKSIINMLDSINIMDKLMLDNLTINDKKNIVLENQILLIISEN